MSKQTLEDIFEEAAIAYNARQEEQAEREQQAIREAQAEEEKERADLHRWVMDWGQPALMPYIRLEMYNLHDARKHWYGELKGCLVEINLPEAMPITFRVARKDDWFAFSTYPSQHGRWHVASGYRIEAIDDDDTLDICWMYHETPFTDLRMAIGTARATWATRGKSAFDDLIRAKERQERSQIAKAEAIKEPAIERTTEERIALALEDIAQTLANQYADRAAGY